MGTRQTQQSTEVHMGMTNTYIILYIYIITHIYSHFTWGRPRESFHWKVDGRAQENTIGTKKKQVMCRKSPQRSSVPV